MLHDTTMYDRILGVLEGECKGQYFTPSDTQTNSLKTTTLFLVAKEKKCRVERKY